MDMNLIINRSILCHHASGDWLVGGGRCDHQHPELPGVAAMETTAAFVCFDEKVSHGGSQ
jgi:hypothetical protein